ncbi:hypothetical protein LINPERPRIM_LOCUS36143 [Linum perenne]
MTEFLGEYGELPRMSDTATSVIVSVVPQKTVPSVVPATWLCESFLEHFFRKFDTFASSCQSSCILHLC